MKTTEDGTAICHACGRTHEVDPRRVAGFSERDRSLEGPDGRFHCVIGCPTCSSDVNKVKAAYVAMVTGGEAWEAYRAENWHHD